MDAYLVPSASFSRRTPLIKRGRRPQKQTVAEAVAPLLPQAGEDVVDLDPFNGQLSRVNDALLRTLGQEDSAITNSTAYSRTLHVQSCATGHQSGEGPTGKRWRDERNGKLANQQKDAESGILKGVVAYISGYTGSDIPNSVLKELIQRLGGKASYTSCTSSTTHIFAPNLSASKTQMLFDRKKKNHAKFVTPEWVVECARKGRRVGEAGFSRKLEDEGQETTRDFFSSSSSFSRSLPPPPSAPSKLSRSSSASPASSISAPLVTTPSRHPSPPPSFTQTTTATADLLAQIDGIRGTHPSSPLPKQQKRIVATTTKRPRPADDKKSTSSTTGLSEKRRKRFKPEPPEAVAVPVEEEDDEEEDEWAMPPSSQRR